MAGRREDDAGEFNQHAVRKGSEQEGKWRKCGQGAAAGQPCQLQYKAADDPLVSAGSKHKWVLLPMEDRHLVVKVVVSHCRHRSMHCKQRMWHACMAHAGLQYGKRLALRFRHGSAR